MNVLSIRQPWAWLIGNEHKDPRRVETGIQAYLTKTTEAAQLNRAADGEATAFKGGIERGIAATKRAIRATWVCLSACDSRKFPECNRLNNVVRGAARTGRSAFDSRPHLPAVEGVKARFHRSSHLELGRPSHDRKFDSRIHGALYSDLRQVKSSCRNQGREGCNGTPTAQATRAA